MRKTIFVIIIFSLIVLLSAVVSNANSDEPYFNWYDVTVSNENGATIYDENMKQLDKKFDYNTKLSLSRVFYGRDAKLYGKASPKVGSYYHENYSEYSGVIISLEDVSLDDEQNFDDGFDAPNDTDTFYYILEDGVYLYNGPGYIYGKMPGDIEVKKGQAVKEIKTKGSPLLYDFAYIQYGDIEGWIPTRANDTPKVGTIYEDMSEFSAYYTTIKLYEDAYLQDEPCSSINEAKPVPKDTELKVKKIINCIYNYYDNFRNLYYVEYNGYEGWIDEYNYIVYSKKEERYNDDLVFFAIKDVSIYKEPNLNNKIKSIEKNNFIRMETFGIKYKANTKYGIFDFIEMDDFEGWMLYQMTDWNPSLEYCVNYDYEILFVKKINYEITSTDDIPVYNGDSVIKNLSKGDIISEFGATELWNKYYVKGEGYEGYVLDENPEIENLFKKYFATYLLEDDESENTITNTRYIEDVPNMTNTIKTTDVPKQTNSLADAFPMRDELFIYVFISLIISFLTLVLLLLINPKKEKVKIKEEKIEVKEDKTETKEDK